MVKDTVDRKSLTAMEIFFLTPQLCIQKMGHMSKTMPLLGVICHPFGKN